MTTGWESPPAWPAEVAQVLGPRTLTGSAPRYMTTGSLSPPTYPSEGAPLLGSVPPPQYAPAQGKVDLSVGAFNMIPQLEVNDLRFDPEQPPCATRFKMCICPCCPTFKFGESDGRKNSITYHSSCLLLHPLLRGCSPYYNCCPWTTTYRDAQGHEKEVGTLKIPGNCDHGRMFACCPMLFCNGEVATAYLHDGGDQQKYSQRMYLSCCWPVVTACGLACGTPCRTCSDCQAIRDGHQYVTTQELVWGPKERGNTDIDMEERPLGEMFQLSRLKCLCCPYREPMRVGVKMYGGKTTDAEMAHLLMLPMLWSRAGDGANTCTVAPNRPIAGSCCTDKGRYAKLNYGNKKQSVDQVTLDEFRLGVAGERTQVPGLDTSRVVLPQLSALPGPPITGM